MPLSKERNKARMRVSRATCVQPKHESGYLYPDGFMRLPDMTVVQPKECCKFKIAMVAE